MESKLKAAAQDSEVSDSDLLDTFGANDITVRCTIDKSWIELSNGEKLRSYDTPREALTAYQDYLNTHER
jgi:hypothetical protein